MFILMLFSAMRYMYNLFSAMGYTNYSISWSVLSMIYLYHFDQCDGVYMFVNMFVSTLGIHGADCYEVYRFVNILVIAIRYAF